MALHNRSAPIVSASFFMLLGLRSAIFWAHGFDMDRGWAATKFGFTTR